MNDYYAILGVLPSAEDIVIKAAYRALAQCYHPDRAAGSAEQSHKRMAEINEAFSVLGDADRRRKYDFDYANNSRDFSELDGNPSQQAESEFTSNSFKTDWAFACDYFPDLVEIFNRLSRIAYRLGVTYQLLMLESKRFNERCEIADRMEKVFLETYFGTNQQLVRFAKMLIDSNQRDALRSLNKAVSVLGSDVPAGMVIAKIFKDFSIESGSYRFSDKQRENAMTYWHFFLIAIRRSDFVEVKQWLDKHPALISLRTSAGETPLHIAVLEDAPQIAAYFVELGASPFVPDASGNTALSIVETKNLKSMAKVFSGLV